MLIIPGGARARSPDLGPEVDFIRRVVGAGQVGHLVTICTGSGVAAQAGVLDGRRVTTNRGAWATVGAVGPAVKWVAPACWAVDGNIWSPSGVSAGLDLIFAFIKGKYPDGPALATKFSGLIEYQPNTNSSHDPWSGYFNIPTPNQL